MTGPAGEPLDLGIEGTREVREDVDVPRSRRPGPASSLPPAPSERGLPPGVLDTAWAKLLVARRQRLALVGSAFGLSVYVLNACGVYFFGLFPGIPSWMYAVSIAANALVLAFGTRRDVANALLVIAATWGTAHLYVEWEIRAGRGVLVSFSSLMLAALLWVAVLPLAARAAMAVIGAMWVADVVHAWRARPELFVVVNCVYAVAGVMHLVRVRSERMSIENQELVGELTRVNAKLAALSITDELTGLFNFRHLHDHLEREFRRFRRYAHATSIMMIDLDHFKHYNDANGHAAGNDALVEVARVVKAALRSADVAARYGGEELCVVVLDPLEGAAAAAERVRGAVADSRLPGASTQPLGCLSVSIGVTTLDSADRSIGDALARADRCLYAAKAGGRNRVVARSSAEDASREPREPSST